MFINTYLYHYCREPVKPAFTCCSSKVTLSGANGHVIMSGYGPDSPDDGKTSSELPSLNASFAGS